MDDQLKNALLAAFEACGMRQMTPEEFQSWLNEQADYRKSHWLELAQQERDVELRLETFLAFHPEFPWTDDMGEISGFGADYELACRAMATAGAAWLATHPDARPRILENENITGIAIPDNADAEALENAVLSPVRGTGPTGAMVQYSTWHARKAHELGWPAYQAKMRERKAEEDIIDPEQPPMPTETAKAE
jgi:hypothetical protein